MTEVGREGAPESGEVRGGNRWMEEEDLRGWEGIEM